MAVHNADDIIRELEKFSPDVIERGERIVDDRLEKFEEKHNLKLPAQYKELIKRHNSIELFGQVIYGSDPSGETESLEMAYEREHFEVTEPQPPYLVPFSSDDEGNFYCFDTRYAENNGECPIVFWESNVTHDEDGPEVVNDSFYEWVMEIFIGWTLDLINYDGSPNDK